MRTTQPNYVLFSSGGGHFFALRYEFDAYVFFRFVVLLSFLNPEQSANSPQFSLPKIWKLSLNSVFYPLFNVKQIGHHANDDEFRPHQSLSIQQSQCIWNPKGLKPPIFPSRVAPKFATRQKADRKSCRVVYQSIIWKYTNTSMRAKRAVHAKH